MKRFYSEIVGGLQEKLPKATNKFTGQTRDLREINISFEGHSIKKHKTVEYLGCQLYFKLSGEAMASKFLKKINTKLKFLHRQSRYPTPDIEA